jgi:hypothetical protein
LFAKKPKLPSEFKQLKKSLIFQLKNEWIHDAFLLTWDPGRKAGHGHRCALVCLNLQHHRGRGCEVFERAQSRFRTRMQRLRTHAPKMQSSTHRRVHLHAVHACMRLYVSAQLRPYLQVIVTTQGPGEQERCLKLRSQDHPGSSACRAIRDLNRN